MQEVKKSCSFVAAFVITFALAIIAVFGFGSVTTAQAAVLGSESPSVYCTYSQEGVEVDGNTLTAGTYDVSFYISGVEAVSVIQVTATYDETVTVSPTPVALMSDNTGYALTSQGTVLSGGDIVFGFVSNNSDCSAIDAEATLIATVTMTFTEDGDAANHIAVADNANLTFVQVNYADGLDDSYAINSTDPEYTQGTLYPMDCDVTPSRGYDVSGSIVVATDYKGATRGIMAHGEFTVDVYSDPDRTVLLKSVKSVENEDSNSFVIDALANGTYYATISSDFAIARNIVINVDGAAIDAGAISIVVCDFNEDSGISAVDAARFYRYTGSDDMRYDLNGDGGVTALDVVIVYSCASSIDYGDITIG